MTKGYKQTEKHKRAKAAPLGNQHAYKGGNVPQHEHVTYYVDGKLQRMLDKAMKDVYKEDDDKLFIICGDEGSGKSVFAQQVCKYVDKSFVQVRICYTKIDFYKCLQDGEGSVGYSIMHDEAFRDFSGRGSLTKEGQELLETIMEVRQENYFIILVIPDARRLASYIKDMRVSGLFYIYKTKNDKSRRRFRMWGKNQAPDIIANAFKYRKKAFFKGPILGKGVFLNIYTVDETEYRNKKREASRKRRRERLAKLEENEKKERAKIMKETKKVPK